MAKSYKNNLRNFSVNISAELYEKLTLMARSEDRSLAAQTRRIVREAVHQWEDALYAEEEKAMSIDENDAHL